MKKKFDVSIFKILFLMFLLNGSYLAPPYNSILRWIPIIILLINTVIVYYLNNYKFNPIPKILFPLLFIMIFSFINLEYGLTYSISRIISFLLPISSFYLFFSKPKIRKEAIEESFYDLATILMFITLINFIKLIFNFSTFGKFTGIYSNQNFLAPIILISTITTLWTLEYNKKHKIFKGFIFAVNYLIIIATGSRSAIFILMLITLFILFYVFNFYNLFKNKKNKTKIFYFLFFLTLMIFLHNVEIESLNRLLSSNDNIYDSTGFLRTNTWLKGLTLFKIKPYFGWGFGVVGYNTWVDNISGLTGWGVHNSYLLILIEHGIIGSIFYLYFFVNFYKNSFVAYVKNKDILLVFLLMVNLIVFINSFSESYLFFLGNPVSFIYWYSVVVIYVIVTRK